MQEKFSFSNFSNLAESLAMEDSWSPLKLSNRTTVDIDTVNKWNMKFSDEMNTKSENISNLYSYVKQDYNPKTNSYTF